MLIISLLIVKYVIFLISYENSESPNQFSCLECDFQWYYYYTSIYCKSVYVMALKFKLKPYQQTGQEGPFWCILD